MAKNKNTFFLIFILFLASLLRLWGIGSVPPGLFGDEVDTGYQAFSILNTGKDYFGNFLPVHFQSFGDWRVPLYIYLDTVFVAIFGLNEIAVRLPAALLGVLGVMLAYFLSKKISGDNKIALVSALLLAISPWHIQISRIGLEAIFLPVLFPLGLIFLWKGITEKKSSIPFLLSGVFFGLTLYSYNTPKLFLPLILFILFAVWFKEIFKLRRKFVIFIITLVLISMPLAADLIKGTGQARFLGISIFSDSTVAERVRFARQNSTEGFLTKIIHNKVTVWSGDFVNNYLSSFSTEFLFLKGDPNPRHSIGGRGEMYLFELPFLLIGLGIFFLKAFKEKDKFSQLLISWIIISPISAALTIGGGTHAIRLFHLLPWFQIVTASGIIIVWNYFGSRRRKLIFSFCFVTVVLVSCGLYLHDYFIHYPKISGRWWNYGYREIFTYINFNQDKYDKIYMSPSWEPSTVYTLFYSKYPPKAVQAEIVPSVNKIGKYYFYPPNLDELKKGNLEKRVLYVLNPAELKVFGIDVESNHALKVISNIYAPDGSPAFVMLTGNDVVN